VYNHPNREFSFRNESRRPCHSAGNDARYVTTVLYANVAAGQRTSSPPRHVAHVPRTVRGRHGPVRVFGQRAGAATGAAGPFVQSHVATDQPDRRRAQGSQGAAPSKWLFYRRHREHRSSDDAAEYCSRVVVAFVDGGREGLNRRATTVGVRNRAGCLFRTRDGADVVDDEKEELVLT